MLGGTNNPGLLRIDPWGNHSCDAAVACRTTALTDCSATCAKQSNLGSCESGKGCVCKQT